MPTLTIKLPSSSFRKVKERAQREGFKDPTEWARILVEKNIALEESPKLKASKIISEMRETNLYREQFLRELKKSLDYADKTAQWKS